MRKEIVLFLSFFLIGIACAQNSPIARVIHGPAVLEISTDESTSDTPFFNVGYTVKNVGGEDAYQLYIRPVPSDNFFSEGESEHLLAPEAVLTGSTAVAISGTARGTYVGALAVEYSGRYFRFWSEPERYFSSSLHPIFLHYGNKTESLVQSTNFSIEMRSGAQAKISVDIENFDNVSHTVEVRLVLAGEFDGDERVMFTLLPKSKNRIELNVYDAVAKPGKTYAALLIVDYEHAGAHYSYVSYGKIRIHELPSFSLFFVLAIGVCVFGLFLSRGPYTKNAFVDLVALIAIYIFLLHFFDPSKIFLESIPAMVDMPPHYLTANYLKDYLIPHGKIYGWAQGWFAGFPILQFYFPLSFLLVELLGGLLPLSIGFKIVTLLGILLLPIVTFFFLKLLGFEFPVPSIGAILSLLFLFNEGGAFFGGSILSTIVGEFSYSISFSLLFLFLGMLYRNIHEKRFSILTGILFALVVLSHIVTAVVGVLSSAYFIVFSDRTERWRNLSILVKTFFLSFALSAFQIVPAISGITFITPTVIAAWLGPLPLESIFIFPLAFYTVLKGMQTKDKRIEFIVYCLFVAVILFFCGYTIIITSSTRFWPVIYFWFGLLAACSIGSLLNSVYKRRTVYASLLTLLLCIFLFIFLKNTSLKKGLDWNYSGLESKPGWGELSGMYSFFADIKDDARIAYEPSPLQNRFGSILVFQLLPYFAKKNTLEGLYTEGSPTSPFVIFTQNEIADECYRRLSAYDWCAFDLDSATKHLELFNARYIIAVSKRLKETLSRHSEWQSLKKIGAYEIYGRVGGKPGYVVVPEYEPRFMNTNDWKAVSFEWFRNNEKVPIVFADAVSDQTEQGSRTHGEDCAINETVFEEEVVFDTNCVGKPHLVKISYHPNWMVEGADRVYLATPSFMLVYPRQSHVRLFFGRTWGDYLGIAITIAGVLLALAYVLNGFIKKIRGRRR
ncbi:MAG: 6-pyruvoyl-tetrahydropterin synthase-related protein [Candidatus Micrarchaeota archaeon]